MGLLLRVDDDSLQKMNLQAARLLVKTAYHEIPRLSFQVQVDGKIFDIRIREEYEDCDDECDDWTVDNILDEDENSWIQDMEEGEFSDGDAGEEDGKSMDNDEKLGNSKNEISQPLRIDDVADILEDGKLAWEKKRDKNN